MITRFAGFVIAAVSAMKCTPQITSTGASSSVARRAIRSESATTSATSCTSGRW